MKSYIGTKLINAKPMDRLAYNLYRGWKLPDDENGTDEGYLVEYLDGGKPNTQDYKGYVSWSPKEQFENAYKQSGNLSFGDALVFLKGGERVAREAWNGKNIYIYYKPEGSEENPMDGVVYTRRPYFMIKTAQDDLAPWVASISDILVDDWIIVNDLDKNTKQGL